MRVPLVRGRDFAATDAAGAPPVAIVNEALARRLWPALDPIGKRVRVADSTEPWRDVIGVVRDTKHASLTEPSRGAYYAPVDPQADSPLSLVVRTSGDSAEVLSSIADIARGIDRDLPLFEMQTLEYSVRQTLNLHRAAASLMGVFGGLTLLLAAIGVYGIATHSSSSHSLVHSTPISPPTHTPHTLP